MFERDMRELTQIRRRREVVAVVVAGLEIVVMSNTPQEACVLLRCFDPVAEGDAPCS